MKPDQAALSRVIDRPAKSATDVPPAELSISVVIAAFSEDRWNDLRKALASVEQQTAPPLETIVIIDHNPSLLERAHELGPGVRVLANREGRGLSGSRNTGVAAAGGAVVAFLDDDAVAEPDWLEHLGVHYADARVLGVGGSIEPNWVGGRPGSFPPEFDWVVGCTYRGHLETAGPIRNLIGANMSFRRGLFDDIGGFRSDMGRIAARPLGCEETEFCLRATMHQPDGLILYEPHAKVRHTVPVVRGSWGYFLRRCYSEGLSKAIVGRLAGSSRGLRSERRYVLRTIPSGVVTNLTEVITKGDASALGRAARMIVGLLTTTAGYGAGTARIRLGPEAIPSDGRADQI